MKTLIDAVTWVAAFDGGKALIWRNEGFDDQPNLKLVTGMHTDNPPDREHGKDRPGRFADPTHGRSAVGQTDLHLQTKTRFVESVINRLNSAAAAGDFDRILLLAPASALGDARPHYSDTLARKTIEYDADVVHQPIQKIDARVIEALTG
jgi:protein required for attachment to host cells